jgi:acetyl-CoA acyltransferase
MADTPSSPADSVPAPSPAPAQGNGGYPAPLRAPNEATVLEEITARADTVWVRSSGPPLRVTRSGPDQLRGPRGRIAIVEGCRTPFIKSGTDFQNLDVIDLAGIAAAELVARTAIDPEEIDLSIFGVVVPALHAPNLGREVVFRASLPMRIPGVTVNLACASAARAMTFGAAAILAGEAEVVLAGGAESLSNVPIQFSRKAARTFMELSRAKTLPQKVGTLSQLRPADLAPVAPAIAEYTTGQSMGESAEKMAKENDISRVAQDEIALMSHQRAAAAAADGRLTAQIAPAFPPPKYDKAVVADNGVRADSSMEALAKLRPVFDKRYGTLTAGNSSPLTDGGSAVLLMSEEKAKALGYTPLGYIRSYSLAAVNPGDQLLQGPAYAAPAALDAAGVTFADLDLVEMHEAFASQILSNLKALASKKFAETELGRSAPVGVIDLERFNVTGGSIAIGHPFGATGARVVIQLLHELKRRGQNLGLATICAAGGVGFAMVVERE